MRVVYLMNGISAGGAAKSLILLLRSLSKYSGIKTFVFAPFCISAEMQSEIEKYSEKLIIKHYPHINANQAYLTSNKKFREIINNNYDELISNIQELKPNIIHINSTTLAYLLKSIKKNIPKVKIVVHLREVLRDPKHHLIGRFLADEIKNNTDIIISISDNEIIPLGNLPNTVILPNPFDFNELMDGGIIKNQIILNDTLKIGMMGSFNFTKGHKYFLEALSIIKRKIEKKFIGIIIGVKKPVKNPKYFLKKLLNRDYYTSLIKYIKKNNLNVQLIESRYSINDFLKEIDIYVRPSIAGDPWGRDIIEAMAYKKAIVATGTSEFFIEDGKTGYLVPPKNSMIMADKIISLIENSEKRFQFGEAGFNKISQMCDLENYGSNLFKIYKNLLNISN